MSAQNHRKMPPLGVVDSRRLAYLRYHYHSHQNYSLDYYGNLVKHDRKSTSRKNSYRHKQIMENPCYVCGDESEIAHHKIPYGRGGGKGKYNAVALCKSCHWLVEMPKKLWSSQLQKQP